MSWQTSKEAIRAAITRGVQFPVGSKAVLFDKSAVPFAGKMITLAVIGQAQEGPDRVVKTMNPDTGFFDVSVSALVFFTVSIRCEHPTGDALELCELARSSLAFPSTRDTLTAAGVVLVGYSSSPVPILGLKADERDVSAYSFDAFFRHELHRSDPVAITTIERVEASGTVAGNPVIVPPIIRP